MPHPQEGSDLRLRRGDYLRHPRIEFGDQLPGIGLEAAFETVELPMITVVVERAPTDEPIN